MLLSRKPYPDWQDIQSEFTDYMASFDPWPLIDIIEFLKVEYPKDFDENELRKVEAFAKGDDESIALFE